MKTQVHVGSEWNHCPLCMCSYLTDHDSHHPACPVSNDPSRCRYCAADPDRPHAVGCPRLTGLYPVTYVEHGTCCALCDTTLTIGAAYVHTTAGRICIGCDCDRELYDDPEDDQP